jgi:tetratricopeptide (TPR) repeat protein
MKKRSIVQVLPMFFLLGLVPVWPQTAAAQTPSGQTAPKPTPEQIEEIKRQSERASAMNALILQAQTAMINKKWQDAIPPLQQLIALDPGDWEFYSALGDAYLNLGQYDQAVNAYQKGIDAAESNTRVDPNNVITDPAKKKAGEAKMLTNQGNAYLKMRKTDQAIAAYTRAANMDPNPATAFFNLCATQYNTGNVDGALAACNKAIALEPNKADAYFIKGSILVAASTTDKNGKVTAPPGTAEAFKKYLELAPNGAHVDDVKQMLDFIGSKI